MVPGLLLVLLCGVQAFEEKEWTKDMTEWIDAAVQANGLSPHVHKREANAYSAFSRSLLPQLIAALRGATNRGNYLYRNPYADDGFTRNIDEMVAAKRNAFWAPMAGPLPVETRFAGFGSRIEPSKSKSRMQSGIKAMRYGRKR